ncbi:MAG: TrfB-related DNA-binding protein [Pseudomonadales bacterium]|nr:TrfB-related DNA-binding protein [Pseudomonadales bacterium]
MLSVKSSVEFLLKNIEQLQGLGKLETILPIFDAMKVLMTQTQFDVSMIDLTMSVENRKVAHQFLVEGLTTAELKSSGISLSRLSKVVARVVENFNKQLNVLGLVGGHYILDQQTAQLVGEMEMAKVNEAKYNLSLQGIKFKGLKTKRKAKRTKKVEASPDASNDAK